MHQACSRVAAASQSWLRSAVRRDQPKAARERHDILRTARERRVDHAAVDHVSPDAVPRRLARSRDHKQSMRDFTVAWAEDGVRKRDLAWMNRALADEAQSPRHFG